MRGSLGIEDWLRVGRIVLVWVYGSGEIAEDNPALESKSVRRVTRGNDK